TARAYDRLPMARERLVVRFRAGPTWTSGSIKEQPGWDDHAEFVDGLVDHGTMVMGGPFCDNSGSLILLEGVGADEARRLVAADPFIQNGVFVLEEIREWAVFVDELTS
ncbi:MAG: YciI family protein, partial [Actinomycetota bacterium]|nr:YciI family protein [Actinomycetota bacterium]